MIVVPFHYIKYVPKNIFLKICHVLIITDKICEFQNKKYHPFFWENHCLFWKLRKTMINLESDLFPPSCCKKHHLFNLILNYWWYTRIYFKILFYFFLSLVTLSETVLNFGNRSKSRSVNLEVKSVFIKRGLSSIFSARSFIFWFIFEP